MIKKLENPNKDYYDQQIGNSWHIAEYHLIFVIYIYIMTRVLEVKKHVDLHHTT